MNPVQLLAQFDRISDAPDAVPRLRRFVLDLAVRGKLVEQDPTDEPASALLKRIDDARARLVKEKLLRKTNVPMPPTADEVPYALAPGWEWSRLSILGDIGPRNELDDATEVSFLPMATIADGFAGTIQPEIRTWGEIKKGFTHVADGDIAMAKITPCFQNRKSAVMRGLKNGVGAGTTELHVVRPINGAIVPEYVLLQLKSHTYLDVGVAKMTGTAGQKRVPKEYFADNPFPLPPLAEQHRIVAKVDELMALCDRLEVAQRERESRRDRLNRASLHRLNNGSEAGAFRDHARFHLCHLPRLATRPEHIRDLRQTILNLAVRGKLVPQDPSDEPAIKSLQKALSAKRLLVASGKVRAEKSLESINPGDEPSALPAGWEWRKIDSLVFSLRNDIRTGPFGSALHKHDHKQVGVPVWGIESIGKGGTFTGRNKIFVTSEKAKELSSFAVEGGDVIISRSGTVGELCRIPDDIQAGLISTNLLKISLNDRVISPDYFCLLFRGTFSINAQLSELCFGSTRLFLTQKILCKILFPIPPLAEQHRIVAKVDELMKLCDQLESQLTTTQTESRRMLEAILHEALHPADKPDDEDSAESHAAGQ